MKHLEFLFSYETGLSVILVVLAIFLLDPFMYWMPHDMTYVILVLLAALFAVFAGLVWREQPKDEREAEHAVKASRTGYMIGTASIVIGIIVQALSGAVSVWLVIALAGMVLGKLTALRWQHHNH